MQAGEGIRTMRQTAFLLRLSLVLGLIGCRGTEPAKPPSELETAQKSFGDMAGKIEAALQADKFTLAPDTSIIYVTAHKDEKVPVKGSLNFTTGGLDLAASAKLAASLTVDLESYDSGLPLRNGRVRQLFFNSDKPDFAKATLVIDAIGEEEVKKLRGDQKLEKVPVTGTLTFHGESKSVKAVLDVGYTWGGRLSVKTATPIVFKISEWQLLDNLEAMMAACGHLKVDDVVTLDVTAEFSPAP